MIMGIMFPSFNNVTLMLILFAAFQIINALFGMEAMAKFDWIAVPMLGIMFAAIVVTVCSKYGVSIPDIWECRRQVIIPWHLPFPALQEDGLRWP